MQGARDLIESERGVFCLALLVCATLLATLHVIDAASWLEFAKWLGITLVASKTVTGALETLRGLPGAPPPPPADPLPVARVVTT